ncbi:M48 family metallopeptidase [Sandaracinus amylolyticus]|uniref:M48 family metallopeptidase n=1 Tax=Sandaracinus amylolyticus TaxID=927083 RepID=UPI001F3C187B|nr:M48 family metallopeptidase [Sandaracinus amylolyticus]UJR82337.1 Hypothetical protein I5071_44020 [Sandaracinus amylolyticus]
MTFRGTITGADDPRPHAVTITIDAGSLRAVRDDGGEASIALDAMTLEPGGFDGDFVFCRPRDARFTIATSDPAFVDALGAANVAELAPQLAKVGRHRASSRRGAHLSKLGALAMIALFGVALWNVPSMLAASVGMLPTSIDRAVGDAATPELGALDEIDDPAASALVEEIRARLVAHAGADGHDIRITIARDEQVNAFALPGGRVVVLTGLLCTARSSDEVAGVLAHEIAHVTRRHGLRNLAHRAGIGLAISLWLGDVEGWTALAADAATLASQSGYSRAQESEADADAVRTMIAAGLDPAALAAFFATMERPDDAAALRWMSTHPDTAERIAQVQALARAERPTRVPLEHDLAALQRTLCAAAP